ncbi:hypothetical protein [Acidovorax sp. Root217]|uniref:hypothetical protein n=1 Tax=Acidovorax sp. Root217 TaxID=1736492 RepID=UPI000708A0AF|nr:hypothetical protein [Acidovorax sp. Root217]KRC22634.1 hypothetical protein ASE31_21670 [Acidovorax sp. Root217]
MRRASRFMPKAQRPAMPWLGRIFVAVAALALLCSLLLFLWAYPVTGCAIAAALWALVAIEGRQQNKRLVQWVQARSGESICQFARAIDCRKVDTWVVRSVYEELQRYYSARWVLPLRATDRLKDDLLLDSEDLDDVLVNMAQRAGRDLSCPQANPFYDRVTTIGDLVHFLNAQPRLATAG